MPPRKAKAKAKQLAKPSPAQLKELPRPKRLSGITDIANGRYPAWRLSFLDLDHVGNWTWRIAEPDLREIVQFLREMERLTWTEVHAQLTSGKRGSHRKHHPMPAEWSTRRSAAS